MTAAIYKITNNVTGRVYIGKSVTVERRIKAHKYGMRRGVAKGCTTQELCDDAAKYGLDAFTFETIMTFDVTNHETMGREEVRLILEHDSMDPVKGYNRTVSVVNSDKFFKRETVRRIEKMNKEIVGRPRFKVRQYDLDGNFIREWASSKMVIDHFKGQMCRQGLQQACRVPNRSGSWRSYRGFRWKMVPR